MTEDIEVIMKLRYATRQAICRTLNTMLMDNIDELNDDIAYWKRVGWDAYDGGDPDKKLNEIKTTIKEF